MTLTLLLRRLGLVLFLLSPCAANEEGTMAKLNWANGDQLSGELVGADSVHLRWQAPVFTEPFLLDMQQLHSVRFPLDDELQRTDEPFRIFMRSGDVVNGRILGITNDQFVVEGKRHGRMVLKRSLVRSFRRLNDPALIFEGPAGLADWSTISRSRKTSDWRTAPQGGLETGVVGAELYRDLRLPAVSEIEITLSWQQKPGFLVTFVEPNARRVPKHTVKLETWDDELVMQALASTGDFEQVQTLSADAKSIQLRLLWDQASGELTAYSRAGELLAKLKSVREDKRNLTCLYIKNKGSDLKISNIRVRSWNGTALSALAEGRAHVHRLDGSFMYGRFERYDPHSATVTVRGEDGPHELKLDEISGADMGAVKNEATATGQIQISYTDGTVLSGSLKSIADNRIRVQTDYSDDPIESTLPGSYVITFNSGTPAHEKTSGDVLEYRGARLQGHLAPVGTGGRLGWKPVGSSNASPLLSTDPARVIRKVSAATPPPDDGKRDMIYLRNGDIIPCRVISIGEERVDVDPAFAKKTTIPRDEVRAICLAADAKESNVNLDHPSWMFRSNVKDAVRREGNRATFNDSGTLAHLSFLTGDSLNFDVEWTANEPVSLTVSIAPHQGGPGNRTFKLYFSGEQVHVQGLQRNQGFVYRHRLREREAHVEVSLKSNRFQLRINGDTALNQPANASRPGRKNVAFAVKRERPVPNAKGQDLLTLANVRAGRTTYVAGAIDLQSDKKEQILTVPRNRKKNPPTHLLVAHNGDILRGRLTGMTSKQIAFRSRFDDLMIPRDRVGMLVWLDKIDEVQPADLPPQKLERPMQAVLLGGITFSFSADQMTDDAIVGQHPFLGACRLPIKRVREVRIGAFTPTKPSAFSEWVLQDAPEPRFATAAGGDAGAAPAFGVDSHLVGTQADDFAGVMVGGKAFELNRHSDKIVVLDFWATWCGPCIRAMPQLIDTVADFPPDKVLLVGINQQENEKTIVDFLEAREWELNVVLDPDGRISQQFRVDAIPQTVVIGPGGKIERLHVGAHADLGEELRKVLTEMVERENADVPAAGG